MDFKELIKLLPNGFHDSRLQSLNIDYSSRKIHLKVLISTASSSSKKTREVSSFKLADIYISDFQFCSVDIPDGNYPYDSSHFLTIDAGEGQPSTAPLLTPEIKPGNFLFWIWVDEWNSFIRIAAKDIALDWK